jgi:hypothetical protein
LNGQSLITKIKVLDVLTPALWTGELNAEIVEGAEDGDWLLRALRDLRVSTVWVSGIICISSGWGKAPLASELLTLDWIDTAELNARHAADPIKVSSLPQPAARSA